MENKEKNIEVVAAVEETAVPEKKAATAAKKTSAKKRSTKVEAEKAEKKVKIVPKNVDPDQYITVKNGFQGMLIYVSNRTGEQFIWDEFGAEQDMELKELKNAKNSSKDFFENNWFMFDDDWVIDYLGVRRFYQNAVRIEDFDEMFTGDVGEIKDTISKLTEGQKRSAAYRARILISEEKIDSRKTIKALEEALGVELIER